MAKTTLVVTAEERINTHKVDYIDLTASAAMTSTPALTDVSFNDAASAAVRRYAALTLRASCSIQFRTSVNTYMLTTDIRYQW